MRLGKVYIITDERNDILLKEQCVLIIKKESIRVYFFALKNDGNLTIHMIQINKINTIVLFHNLFKQRTSISFLFFLSV